MNNANWEDGHVSVLVGLIWGGAGKDIYVFSKGDGVDTVIDSKTDHNLFRFGADVDKDAIKLRLGSLMLDLGDGDAVHIDGFDQNDVFNRCAIDHTADGRTAQNNSFLEIAA